MFINLDSINKLTVHVSGHRHSSRGRSRGQGGGGGGGGVCTSPPPPPPPNWLNRPNADSTPHQLVESAEGGQHPPPLLDPPLVWVRDKGGGGGGAPFLCVPPCHKVARPPLLGTGIYRCPICPIKVGEVTTSTSLKEKLTKVIASATDTEGSSGRVDVCSL